MGAKPTADAELLIMQIDDAFPSPVLLKAELQKSLEEIKAFIRRMKGQFSLFINEDGDSKVYVLARPTYPTVDTVSIEVPSYIATKIIGAFSVRSYEEPEDGATRVARASSRFHAERERKMRHSIGRLDVAISTMYPDFYVKHALSNGDTVDMAIQLLTFLQEDGSK